MEYYTEKEFISLMKINNYVIDMNGLHLLLDNLKEFRKNTPKLSSLEELDNLLNSMHILNFPKSKPISKGIINVYEVSSGQNFHEDFLNIYDFMIDNVLQDDGGLFKNDKIVFLNTGIKSAKITKFEAFLILSYLFLNITKLPHSFYNPGITYSANYNKFFCILNYFFQIRQLVAYKEGLDYLHNTHIIISRRMCREFNNLKENEDFVKHFINSEDKLTEVVLSLEGSYDLGRDGVECDFANEYLGGGVLQTGRVQEEIKFVINPELIACIFFNLVPMADNETIFIVGCEQFSHFKGYANSLQYDKNAFHLEESLKYIQTFDSFNYYNSCLLAIDASYLYSYNENFNSYYFVRDLKKAYVGFMRIVEKENLPLKYNEEYIVTGKWGCGAFNGDPEIKFLTQWLSSSINQRKMIFSCYNDIKVYDKITNFMKFVDEKKITIGHLIKSVMDCFETKEKDYSFFDKIIGFFN